MPLVCLRFVIVVFPDYTHLLFFAGQARAWACGILNTNISLVLTYFYRSYDNLAVNSTF